MNVTFTINEINSLNYTDLEMPKLNTHIVDLNTLKMSADTLDELTDHYDETVKTRRIHYWQSTGLYVIRILGYTALTIILGYRENRVGICNCLTNPFKIMLSFCFDNRPPVRPIAADDNFMPLVRQARDHADY